MKTTKIILDDDFIGGQGNLTTEEELALSDYFKNKKMLSNFKSEHAQRTLKRKNFTI